LAGNLEIEEKLTTYLSVYKLYPKIQVPLVFVFLF